MRAPGVERDPFGGGRLARVDVGDDADVAQIRRLELWSLPSILLIIAAGAQDIGTTTPPGRRALPTSGSGRRPCSPRHPVGVQRRLPLRPSSEAPSARRPTGRQSAPVAGRAAITAHGERRRWAGTSTGTGAWRRRRAEVDLDHQPRCAWPAQRPRGLPADTLVDDLGVIDEPARRALFAVFITLLIKRANSSLLYLSSAVLPTFRR